LNIYLILCLILFAGCQRREPNEVPAIRQVVAEFGQELKQVELGADRETAIAAIEKHYRRLVSPTLMEEWMADPSRAPGRLVSSPSPDRIEIDSVLALSGSRYRVVGRVMEMTSVEVSQHLPGSATPVEMTLEKEQGRWLITQYSQPEDTEPAASSSEEVTQGRTEAPDSVSAVAVLNAYYEAINKKDYPQAYALWVSNGEASGKTLDQFTAGFARTESVDLTVGAPGPIGAAAGSRYIEIPVTIDARLSNGKEQHFTGTYTLRRSVVDGATAEQRAWRIYKAHITEKSS